MKAESWSDLFLCLPNGRFPIKHSEALKARYPPSLCADTFLVRSGTDPPAVSSDRPARAPMTGHYHLDQGRPLWDWGSEVHPGAVFPQLCGGGKRRERQTLGRLHGLHPSGSRAQEPASPGPPGGSPSSRSSPRLRGLTRRGHRRLAPEPGSGVQARLLPGLRPHGRPTEAERSAPAAAPGSRLDGQGPLAAPARSLAPGPCPLPAAPSARTRLWGPLEGSGAITRTRPRVRPGGLGSRASALRAGASAAARPDRPALPPWWVQMMAGESACAASPGARERAPPPARMRPAFGRPEFAPFRPEHACAGRSGL